MLVMAGLVPAIHAFAKLEKAVDARPKAGHDAEKLAQGLTPLARACR
jgi:hypothetical protein